MWHRILILFILVSSIAAKGGRGGVRSGGSSHTYPRSHGYSGTGSGGSHTYPQSTGLSGNSPNHVQKTYTQQHGSNYGQKTEVHHHYNYNPPHQISYGSTYHPVYQAPPPVYVYQYRDSGSRFDSLLTGLALYNLGRMSASHNHYDPHREYRPRDGEICKMGISKQNGEYEETRIECKLMSSYIWEAESGRNNQVASSNTVTTTTVNVTTNSNATHPGVSSNSSVSTTVTVQNKTVVDALQVKGPSMKVTPGMNCFMIRISRDSSILKKKVECGLLQAYAQNSLHYNNCRQTTASLLMILSFSTLLIVFSTDSGVSLSDRYTNVSIIK